MSRSFDKFNKVLDVYMPAQGEGDNVASQIATAVAKMAYRWFNDGDTVNSDWDVAGASRPPRVKCPEEAPCWESFWAFSRL